MATITSVGSGLWSAAGTWDAGVPLDGDDVIVSAGHTVTFDVNQSAFVTGVSVLITGILEHSIVAGSYCLFLKTGTAVSGAGTWNVGKLGYPIPLSVKHIITGASGWSVDGAAGLKLNVYATEPINASVKVASAVGVGDTVINIDTDLTSDIWADGDIIQIGKRGITSHYHTIAVGGIGASTITLTAGTSTTFGQYDNICLLTRSVEFIGVAAHMFNNFTSGTIIVTGGSFETGVKVVNSWRVFSSCSGIQISGGIFWRNSETIRSGAGHNITGGVFSGAFSFRSCAGDFSNILVTNSEYAFWTCGTFNLDNCRLESVSRPLHSCGGSAYYAFISNCLFYDYISCISNTRIVFSNTNFDRCGGYAFDGGSEFYFENCNFISVTLGSLWVVTNSSLVNCSLRSGSNPCVSGPKNLLFYNCLFTGALVSSTVWQDYNISINHNQIVGNIRGWVIGGSFEDETTIVPSGYTWSYKLIGKDDDQFTYVKKSFSVSPGETFNVHLHLRKDLAMSYLPRAVLLRDIDSPIFGSSPLQSFIMTDSIDVWESETFSITNSSDYAENYVLWFLVKSSTGFVYVAYDIESIPTDLAAVLAHLVDIKGIGWVDENLAALSADHALLATSAEIAALNDLDAAGIRAAIGLALANIDQQFLNTIGWQATRLDESITEGEIIQVRGNSWVLVIEDLALDPNKQQFAIKCSPRNASLSQCSLTYRSSSPDADSILFVDSDTGLLYVNGVAAADPSLGTLAYVGTTLTVTLGPSITAQLPPGIYSYGIQSVDVHGYVSEPYGGTFTITADIVRSVT
jgi:hypothetical protein